MKSQAPKKNFSWVSWNSGDCCVVSAPPPPPGGWGKPSFGDSRPRVGGEPSSLWGGWTCGRGGTTRSTAEDAICSPQEQILVELAWPKNWGEGRLKLWVKGGCSLRYTQTVPKWHLAGQPAGTHSFNVRLSWSVPFPPGRNVQVGGWVGQLGLARGQPPPPPRRSVINRLLRTQDPHRRRRASGSNRPQMRVSLQQVACRFEPCCPFDGPFGVH